VYLVGVTGGIGSGKSTVTGRLAAHGCHVIDADAVAREIVAPGEPTLAELAERFGSDIVLADGSLDRRLLAARAFTDDEARADLDRITHPRVAARIAERIATIGADEDPGGRPAIVVVDHPLLLETGQAGRFDAVVVVLADEETRVRRLTAARGMDEVDARARMRAQVDDDARRAAATFVLVNDGARSDLEVAVDEVYERLVAAASAAARPGSIGRC
jgi:dephospho-CoA kinase